MNTAELKALEKLSFQINDGADVGPLEYGPRPEGGADMTVASLYLEDGRMLWRAMQGGSVRTGIWAVQA